MDMSALDESGKPVDYWFAYKVPKLAAGAGAHSAVGYEYAYYDPKQKKLAPSPYLMNSGKGALDATLNSVFKKPGASTGWLLYNDEMPASAKGSDDGSFGHTKGVIAFDTASKTQTVPVLLADQYLDSAVELATAADVAKLLGGCTPSGANGGTCVRGFIEKFGRRAFRRPLASGEVDKLVTTFTTASAAADANTGVRAVVAGVLASPNFLFRPETGGAASALPGGPPGIASPWSKKISEHGPHGPVSPIAQKLSEVGMRMILESGSPATLRHSPAASSSSE